VKKGKPYVLIALLSVIILIALVPWYFIISRNLSPTEPPQLPSETEAYATPLPPPDTEPEPPVTEPLPPVTDPSSQTTEQPPPVTEPSSGDNVIDISSEYPELGNELDRMASRFNCVSASLVIFDGDKGEYYTYQYGYSNLSAQQRVDTDTKFRVASLSKLTTVICAMILVDEGKLDLDEDISTYLGYTVKNPVFPATSITTRMLMQHTSSIFDSSTFQSSRDKNSSDSTQRLLDTISSYRRREPGLIFEYTNFGYSVLAAVCEKVSGIKFDAFARDKLFDPLGIDAAYVASNLTDQTNIAVIYNDSHTVTRSVQTQLNVGESSELGFDNHLAQGNLTISTLDYARVLAMLRSNNARRDHTILSERSARAIHNASVSGPVYEQGLATRLSPVAFMPGENAFWHTGSAFGTYAQYVYSNDGTNRGVVVVTTGSDTGRDSYGMVNVCTEMSALVWRRLGF